MIVDLTSFMATPRQINTEKKASIWLVTQKIYPKTSLTKRVLLELIQCQCSDTKDATNDESDKTVEWFCWFESVQCRSGVLAHMGIPRMAAREGNWLRGSVSIKFSKLISKFCEDCYAISRLHSSS